MTDHPNRCCICGTAYVVDSLARDFERRHEKETAP